MRKNKNTINYDFKITTVIKNHWISYLIDIISFIFIILVAILELTGVFNFGCIFHLNNDYGFIILTGLLPLVITLVSLIFSIGGNKVYRIPLWELNQIQKPSYFDIGNMFFVCCVLFLSSLFSYSFELNITKIFIEITVFIFSIIFGFQRLTLLINQKMTAFSLIKFGYLKRNSFSNDTTKAEIFDKLLRNIVLTADFPSLYEYLSLKIKEDKFDDGFKMKLFTDAFDKQNNYFFDLLKASKCNLIFTEGNYDGFNILTAVKNGFYNLEWVLLDFSIKNKEFINLDNCFLITRPTFILHELSTNLSTSEFEKRFYGSIVTNLILFNNEKLNNSNITFLLMMMTYTIKKDETWFLKFYRDYSGFAELILNKELSPLTTIITMYIVYALSNFKNFENTNLFKFLDESNESLNSKGDSWKDLFKEYVENSSSEQLCNLIGPLLQIYDLIYREMYYIDDISLKKKNESEYFSNQTIFIFWFEMLCVNDGIEVSDLKNTLNSLNDNYKNIVCNAVSYYFIDKYNPLTFKFLDFFFKQEKDIRFAKNNAEQLMEFFIFFQSDFCLEKINKEGNNIYENKLKVLSDELFNEIKTNLTNNVFYKQDLEVGSTSKIFTKNITFRTRKINEFFEYLIEDLFENAFNELIIAYINNCSKTIFNVGKNYTEETLKNIKEGKYDYCTSKNDEKNIVHESICGQLKESKFPLKDFFYKDNTIKINAILDKDNIYVIRTLSNDIEKYIDENFAPAVYGLYRYKEIGKENSILVSRSKLISLLSEELFTIHISFRYSINIEKDKCLLIKSIKEYKL